MSDTAQTVGREATDLLSRYLRIDTTNPPGNERPAAEWLRDQLRDHGIPDVSLYARDRNRPIVVARIPGDDNLKPLVLNHHLDVVPAVAEDWTHAPFDGVIAEGYVWGRGALDTKCLGIMHLLALARLIRENATFRRPIIMLAVPDEEAGGRDGMEWLVDHHLAELDPEWVWDEGGYGVDDMIPGQVMMGVAVAEKCVQQYRVRVTGQPGHGAMPHGDMAPAALIQGLDRVLSPRPIRINPVMQRLCEALADTMPFPASWMLRHMDNPLCRRLVGPKLASSGLLGAMMRDTISLTQLSADSKINVIPAQAEAGLDCRLLPETDPEAFREWLQERLNGHGSTVTIERLSDSQRASVSPLNNSFFGAIEAAVANHVPNAVVVPLLMPGGSDARFFRQRGIPAYGLAPAVIHQSETRRVHGIDERISIDNLVLGTNITYDIIRALCVAET